MKLNEDDHNAITALIARYLEADQEILEGVTMTPDPMQAKVGQHLPRELTAGERVTLKLARNEAALDIARVVAGRAMYQD